MDPPASPSRFIYDANHLYRSIRQSTPPSSSTSASDSAQISSLRMRFQRETTVDTLQTNLSPHTEQAEVGASRPARSGVLAMSPCDFGEYPAEFEAAIQQRQHLRTRFSVIHKICLEAAQKYMRDRHINRQMRSIEPAEAFVAARNRNTGLRGRRCSFRHSPYTSTRNFGDGRYSPADLEARPDADADAPTTGSLLANISCICDELWLHAQRERLHVPGTERAAVENMARLLEWAETVVWNATAEENETLLGFSLREFVAGKSLCLWLGDTERWDMLVALV